ncbi:MAG: 50S ribosomal protein L25 [Candidatus Omnitrophica bacterium]|nr:50S ribosomal protein L25 [Candidatus Omnitrophota bacterium]
MEEIKLDVQIRKEVGRRSVKSVRQEDSVPAVVYGGDREPTNIKFDRRTYEKIRRQHQGESIVFHLNVCEGEKKLRDYSVIVKEEQHNPVSDKIVHIDFKRISLKEEIEVKVPIAAKGEASGVKNDDGSLDHTLWELDVVCLPTDIPQHLDVDVSALEIGGAIHVKDIVLPQGVKTNHDPEAVVLSVLPPRREEEEAPTEVDVDAEPEVIKEKKEEKAAAEEAAE